MILSGSMTTRTLITESHTEILDTGLTVSGSLSFLGRREFGRALLFEGLQAFLRDLGMVEAADQLPGKWKPASV